MALSAGARGESVLGRYVLGEEIASGGMASVHFGRLVGPVGFSRVVAIKRLHAQYAKDPDFVSMLIDEAHLAGRIRHPNVVSIGDVISSQGELLLVMDYVAGETLAQLLKTARAQGQLVPVPVAVGIAGGVLLGLHAAHEARGAGGAPLGIVHRDVSPQNILVGSDGIARVLDFGIATATWRVQTTREGQIKGKLRYMPVEQLQGAAVDRRADVFAASVVLWETVTGARLLDTDDPAAIVTHALTRDVPAPSSRRADLPASLDTALLRGLSRRREERYESALDMAIALEDAVKPATARQIAEWAESLAGDALRARAARAAEIEAAEQPWNTPARDGDEATRANAVEPSATSFGQRPRASRRGALVLAGALLALAVWALLSPRRNAAGPRATTSAVTAAAIASDGAASAAAVLALPSAVSEPTKSTAALPSSSARARRSGATRPVAPRAGCDPPFTLVDGLKRWRRECL